MRQSCTPLPLPSMCRIASSAASKSLALTVLACAAGVAAAVDHLAIPSWAFGLVQNYGGLDPQKLIELPPGCNQYAPCSNSYFSRWLACSTLTSWYVRKSRV